MPNRLISVVALVVVLVTLELGAPASAVDLAARGWVWPMSPVKIGRPYEAPAHEYAPGHRGIDLVASEVLRAPADGVIAFSGPVGGRELLTIDHGDGLVTTLEPIETTLTAGAVVTRSQPIARPALGGHAAPGSIHFGVRLHGEYVNPLLLLGGVPRAVLLPCC